MPTSRFSVDLPHPPADVLAWHARPGALERMVPPWAGIRVLSHQGGLTDHRVELSVPLGCGLRRRWIAQHQPLATGSGFRDVQERGPFARWEHEHRFEAIPEGCRLTDAITWDPPLGALGRWLAGGRISRELARTFRFRHARLRADLDRHAGIAPQVVALSGAGGLLGTALAAFLGSGGHAVRRLRRPGATADGIAWDPAAGRLDPAALAGCAAVIHLGGATVAQPWTARGREAIRSSRIASTRLLAETIARTSPRPRTLIVASAVGIYGERGEEELTEESLPGGGFLAEVCRDWESAADPARAAGVRVVHVRLGVVLAADGGALARMLPPFRAGLGGRIGSGRQWLPWIHRDDAVAVFHRCLVDADLSGAINAVAPQAVRQGEFARTLARTLHRPCLLPLPGFAVGMLLGDMGRSLLLGSQRIVPARLHQAGFAWRFPELAGALADALGQQ